MNQIASLYSALTARQKFLIGAGVLVAAAAFTGILLLRGEGDFRILYRRLSPEDMTAASQKLKESDIEFRVSEDGGALLVRSSAVAAGRLALATAGLPKSGRVGFELFDKTNLTATDFAEHVNYARALEGELERSIQLIDEVDRARVHITSPKESVFVESRQPAKASVVIGTKPGRILSQANVNAIRNLVASAVQGLTPETVAVVDVRGELLGRPRRNGQSSDDLGGTDAFQEYRVGIEREMQAKLTQALDPVLGEGKFRTGISVDCEFASKEESEEALDPTRTVVLNEQKSEESSGAGQSAGIPGTASALPRPTSRPASSSGTVSRKTESSTYQATRSIKSVKTPRGQIKRISAAILVDYDLQWKGSGSKSEMVLVPPPNEKLQVIRQISSSILGLQENRGDQITVDSLAFDYTLSLMKQSHVATQGSGTSNQGDWLKSLWNGGRPTKETIVQGGALIVLFLVCLVSIILWRKRDRTRIRAGVETARALPAGAVDIGETAFIQGGLPSDRPRVAGSAQPAPQMTDRIREDVRRDPRLAASVVRRMISDAG